MMSTLDYALAYAENGWHVIPVKFEHDGTTGRVKKPPLLLQWQTKATTDPDTITKWFTQWPDAGIAIHAGKSDVVVLDIDPRNGGVESVRQIESEGDILRTESTLSATTGGGGEHYVFRAPSNVTTLPPTLGEGVDLLHGNHYFVVAPSVNPFTGGKYEWRDDWNPQNGLDPLLDMCPLPDRAHTVSTGTVHDAWTNESMADTAPPQETIEQVERVKSALAVIPSDIDRAEWLRVLMALHWTGWKCSRELAHDWSELGYDNFNGREFDGDWRALGRRSKGKKTTLGTLFYMARGRGWHDPTQPASGDAVETYGDTSNGYRFANKYRGQFLHVHASGEWVKWDGARWAICDGGQAVAAARVVVGEALDDAHGALKADPTDKARSNHGHALSVHRNVKRHEALLKVAATVDGMGVPNKAAFDADPWLLGVHNGIVNLRTGKLLPAQPSYRISKQAGAPFNPDAKCPRWLEFLMEIFEGDTEKVAYMQRACGYALTGLTDEQKLFFMHGHGANGKSAFSNVLQAAFGEYAVTLRSTLLARDSRGNSNDAEREKYRLPGARLALINEVGTHDVFDDQRLKEVVGSDSIGARALYGESFEFKPTHTIFVRGNHQPGVLDSGDGFWRRLVLIEFRRQFNENERDPNLERDIIKRELEGVLIWMVSGCQEWQRVGLRIPASMAGAAQEYRHETDVLGQWLEDACVRGACESIFGHLHASYREYLRCAGMNAPSTVHFGRQLAEKGFTKRKSNGKTIVVGLMLSTEAAITDELQA